MITQTIIHNFRLALLGNKKRNTLRRLTKFMILPFLLLLFAVALWAANQVTNGSFTTDLSNWTPSPSATANSSNASPVFTGSSYYLTLSGVNADQYIYQSGIATTTGTDYILYMYMKSATGNSHSVRFEAVALVGDSYTKTHNITATSSWTLATFKFNRDNATSLRLNIYPETGSYVGEATWFDEVNLTQYPGTISSIGTSLGSSAGHLQGHFYLNDSNGIVLNLSTPANFYPFDAFGVEEYVGNQWIALTEGAGAGQYSKILTANSDQVTGFRIHTSGSVYPNGAYTFRIKATRLAGTSWAETAVRQSCGYRRAS
jgi:Carbohydrate binding domain